MKPYTLDEARRELTDAINRQAPRHRLWNQLEHMYATGAGADDLTEGDAATGKLFGPQAVPDIPTAGVNLALSHLSLIIGSIADRNPQFGCEPIGYGDGHNDAEEAAARAAEALISHWFRVCGGKKVLALMAKDLEVLGPAFAKTGWRFAEEPADRDAAEVADEIAAAFAENPDADPDEVAAAVSATKLVTVEDAPFIEYVSPYDIYAHRSATHVTDARWVAQRIIKPADEVRADLDLPETVTLNRYAPGGVASVAPVEAGGGSSRFELVEFFEFYDVRTKRLLVFQLNGELLHEGPFPFEHGRPPFAHITRYKRNNADFYGFGSLINIAGLHHMVNDFFDLQLDNASRSGSTVIADNRLLTPEVKDAIADPTHNGIVGVDVKGGALSEGMVVVPNPPTSADVYNANADLRNLMAETLGLSEMQRGQLSAGSRVSGTAAAAVEGYSNVRTADAQYAMADAATEIGTQILDLCRQFQSDAVTLRIVGPEGSTLVRQLTGYELDGFTFHVVVDGDATARTNPAVREQRAMELLNTVVPALSSLGYDPDKYVRQALKDLRLNPDWLTKTAPEPAPAPPAGPPAGMDPMAGMPADLAQMAGMTGEPVLPETPEALGLPASPEAMGIDLVGSAQAGGGLAF